MKNQNVKDAIERLHQLESKAISAGMEWETDQSPMFAENHLGDLISDVVDDVGQALKLLEGDDR